MRDWKPLRYFSLYRTLLAGCFCIVGHGAVGPIPLGSEHPEMFRLTATLYFAFSLVAVYFAERRWPALDAQVATQVFADLAALSLLMSASGAASGFGMLMLVAVAGGSVMTEGRIAILFAATASLALLAQLAQGWIAGSHPIISHTQAGMMGLAFFATAALMYRLAQRIRTSEALAARHALDLANLVQLNEYIIQRMQSGILVVDSANEVRLHNESALALLGMGSHKSPQSLSAGAAELAARLSEWRQDKSLASVVFRPASGEIEVMASFARLGHEGSDDGVLVFLEDASAMRQRAQRLKLASLGRLTASIAHEIRNPLGAISHASQLLAESSTLPAADRRLIQIVQDNCGRMNSIIENVLQLSRRKASISERVTLRPWLERFVHDFSQRIKEDKLAIKTKVDPADLQVRIDPVQLQQVLWNLCENAVRHALGAPQLQLRAGRSTETRRPYLDVIDNGPGVDSESVEDIFEPFFTTQPEGTGLGLYIARELCESNQATLGLMPSDGSGCRFRITFSDPRRKGTSEP